MKLTKQDFKNNGYNLMLCSVYTVILSIIYGVWAQKALNIWWLTLIIVVVIIILGVVVGLLWTKGEAKKHKEEIN